VQGGAPFLFQALAQTRGDGRTRCLKDLPRLIVAATR